MKIIGNVRNTIAKLDTENSAGKLDNQTQSKAEIVKRNGLDVGLQTANAFVAGTPLSWATGGVTVAVGIAKLLGGIGASLTAGWVGSEQAANRMMASGLKSILAGATAPIPGVGHVVNATLAAVDVAQAANSAIGSEAPFRSSPLGLL